MKIENTTDALIGCGQGEGGYVEPHSYLLGPSLFPSSPFHARVQELMRFGEEVEACELAAADERAREEEGAELDATDALLARVIARGQSALKNAAMGAVEPPKVYTLASSSREEPIVVMPGFVRPSEEWKQREDHPRPSEIPFKLPSELPPDKAVRSYPPEVVRERSPRSSENSPEQVGALVRDLLSKRNFREEADQREGTRSSLRDLIDKDEGETEAAEKKKSRNLETLLLKNPPFVRTRFKYRQKSQTREVRTLLRKP